MDEKFNKTLNSLKTLRDEVRLQIHLGKAELRDEFDALEDRWQDVERSLEDVRGEAREAAEEAQNTMHVIAEELSAAYQRIKDRLD